LLIKAFVPEHSVAVWSSSRMNSTSTTLIIPTAKVFEPLVKADGARYLGAWGGRGSGKSWFFAEKLVERCLLQPGLRAVAEQPSPLREARAAVRARYTLQALSISLTPPLHLNAAEKAPSRKASTERGRRCRVLPRRTIVGIAYS
jgi:hypothetical protein